MESGHRSSSSSSGYHTGNDSGSRRQQQQQTKPSSSAKALFRVASSSDDDAKSSDSGGSVAGGGSAVVSRSGQGRAGTADKNKVKQELLKLRRLSDAAAAADIAAAATAAAAALPAVPAEGDSAPGEKDLVDIMKFAYIIQVRGRRGHEENQFKRSCANRFFINRSSHIVHPNEERSGVE